MNYNGLVAARPCQNGNPGSPRLCSDSRKTQTTLPADRSRSRVCEQTSYFPAELEYFLLKLLFLKGGYSDYFPREILTDFDVPLQGWMHRVCKVPTPWYKSFARIRLEINDIQLRSPRIFPQLIIVPFSQ